MHDKYQRFDQSEGQLADYRSSYTAAVTTALVAAMVYAVVNLLPKSALLFATTVSLLAAFGVLISLVWAVVLRRTTQAQQLWRDAAFRLEEDVPPVEGTISATLSASPTRSISVDLARPYHVHLERFAGVGTSRLDRIRPADLTSQVPVLLVVVWSIVVAGAWVWYAFAH